MIIVGVRRDLKMILSHMASSCFNMSSYRTIWTHLRLNSMMLLQNVWLLVLDQVLVVMNCALQCVHHMFACTAGPLSSGFAGCVRNSLLQYICTLVQSASPEKWLLDFLEAPDVYWACSRLSLFFSRTSVSDFCKS